MEQMQALHGMESQHFGDTGMLHYQFIAAWMKAQAKTERGASLVEYALLVALIAVVCIAAVTLLGSTASEKFSEISSGVDG